MTIIDRFLDWRIRDELQKMEILLLSLDLVLGEAWPFLEDQVKQWDLENRSLALTLGYIAGFIDAAYQMTKPSKYNERVVQHLFDERVAQSLAKVPGIDSYLRLTKAVGGGSIGGMQALPPFMEGTMAGGNDFGRFVNEKRAPSSLVSMLLHMET